MRLPAPPKLPVSVCDVASGSVVRLFYPSLQDARATHHDPYVPSSSYAVAYANFLSIPSILGHMLFTPTLSLVQSPLSHTAPINPSENNASRNGFQNLPLVVFSHGLGGMRTTYSSLCSFLASHGFIVAAVEHADGSACLAATNNNTQFIPYTLPKESDIQPGETRDEYLKRYRSKQSNIRSNEILKTFDIISQLNAGNHENIVALHDHLDMKSLKNRINLENPILIGHSFGSASVYTTLANPNHPFKLAITLDPWMFPIPEHILSSPPQSLLSTPILTIQSDSFHWKENFDDLVSMHSRCRNNQPKSMFGVLKNSGHQDPSDFPLLFPWIMKRIGQSGPNPPHTTFDTLINWILEFIRINLPDIPLEIPVQHKFHFIQDYNGEAHDDKTEGAEECSNHDAKQDILDNVAFGQLAIDIVSSRMKK